MGENSIIKRFDCYPPNYTCPLFPTRENRMPVVRKILSSPWVRTASDLLVSEEPCGYGLGKRSGEKVQILVRPVEERDSGGQGSGCSDSKSCLYGREILFTWRKRRYRIHSVLDSWRIEEGWWEASGGSGLLCFRVLASAQPKRPGPKRTELKRTTEPKPAIQPQGPKAEQPPTVIFDLSYDLMVREWRMEGWWD